MASIKIVDSLPYDKWVQFVEGHPDGNIFHTPFMFEVFRRTKNYEPFLFAAINEDDKQIQFLMVSCQIKIFNGVLSRFSSRMVSYGGIINNECENNSKGISNLMEYYDRVVRNQAVFTEIRNMSNTEAFMSGMAKSGYQYEEYLNYIVNLKRDPSDIFRSFSESRRRNIRALERKGVYSKEASEPREIETFYDIICETYSRVKIPIADISLFKAVMEILVDKGMAKFLFAIYKDKKIASILILLYKGVIITWYYGTYTEFQKLSPTSLLIWDVIKWGSSNGCRLLDFGGAGRPGEKYGVRDFKTKFHGELTNYGRYIKIYSPALLKIANVGYRIYRKTALPYDWQK